MEEICRTFLNRCRSAPRTFKDSLSAHFTDRECVLFGFQNAPRHWRRIADTYLEMEQLPSFDLAEFAAHVETRTISKYMDLVFRRDGAISSGNYQWMLINAEVLDTEPHTDEEMDVLSSDAESDEDYAESESGIESDASGVTGSDDESEDAIELVDSDDD